MFSGSRNLGNPDLECFRQNYDNSLEETIRKDRIKREPKWTEAIAVGSHTFVEEMECQIKGRQNLEIQSDGDAWVLLEQDPGYHDQKQIC